MKRRQYISALKLPGLRLSATVWSSFKALTQSAALSGWGGGRCRRPFLYCKRRLLLTLISQVFLLEKWTVLRLGCDLTFPVVTAKTSSECQNSRLTNVVLGTMSFTDISPRGDVQMCGV